MATSLGKFHKKGGTDVPITDGGTGASVAATGLANLGHGSQNHSGIAGVGKVVQKVRNSSGSVISSNVVIPFDDTPPLNSEGALAMSLSITPLSLSNRLYIRFTGFMDGGALLYTVSLHRNSGAAIAATTSGVVRQPTLVHSLGVPALALQTFTIRMGPFLAGICYLNADSAGTRRYGGVGSTTLTVWEVAP